jgi:hypothetical protein
MIYVFCKHIQVHIEERLGVVAHTVIPTLGRLKQEDLKFEASLS